jgi:hypothetical protein
MADKYLPAFPHTIEHLHEPMTTGMTLRDYFAARAMQALVSADSMRAYEYVTNDAYGYADAMLKAR